MDKLSQLAAERLSEDLLFAILDANADPGHKDDYTVFEEGFKTTANTNLFRTFLQEHGHPASIQHFS